jgi:chorismate dehydratase
MSSRRLGLVSYLNTAPYRYGLRELGETDWAEAVPARLLPLMEQGEVEASTLPAFDVLAHPDLLALPSCAIASFGPALSVKLFSRIALRHVTSVALDTSSHTSAALTRVALAEMGAHPIFLDMPPDLEKMLACADAALLIGDPCMRADGSEVLVTDLGQLWLELTGAPFVFALWAARPGADCAALDALVIRAKEIGVSQVEQVAALESARLGFRREEVLTYLRDHLRYDLDGPTRVGLERFRKLLVKHGLIADHGPVQYQLEDSA